PTQGSPSSPPPQKTSSRFGFFRGNQDADRSPVRVEVFFRDPQNVLRRHGADSRQIVVDELPFGERLEHPDPQRLAEDRVLAENKRRLDLVFRLLELAVAHLPAIYFF